MSTIIFPNALRNGDIIPFADAQISLAHPVFLTSFGVYESIQVEKGRPFCLSDHLSRLGGSAAQLGIALPPFDTLLDWGQRLIETLPQVSYALQILVIGSHSGGQPLTVFLPKEIATYPAQLYEFGASAITFSGRRVLPQCKSFNTLINHLSRTEARESNALEAILVSDGCFLEGARSNVFVVSMEGQLVTPPADKTLSGITKDVVIKTMAATPHPVLEADIPANTPIAEIFITSTSMHVMPITKLNGHPVGGGQVGPASRMAIQQFEQFYQNAMRKILG